MAEHSILFSGDMVRAILAGTKTQTRRVINPQPPAWCTDGRIMPLSAEAWWFGTADWSPVGKWPDDRDYVCCPYGVVGDELWCRETWSYITLAQNERQPGDRWDPQLNMPVRMLYRADGYQIGGGWSPSIHMPRWASRLTLCITGVRVERLQNITDEDVCAETGWPREWPGPGPAPYERDLRGGFAEMWDEIHIKRPFGFTWEHNPWVWVIEFERVE
jgi:hypothetical protein